MGGSLDAPEWPSARSLSTALPGRMHLAERLLQSSSSRTDSSSRWSPSRPQSAPGIPRDRVRTSRIHPETEPRLQLLPCPAVPPPLLRARPNARQESEHLPDKKRCHVSECVALRAVAELVGHPRRAGQTQLSPVRSTSASAKACIRKEWRIVNAWQR